MIAKSHKHRLVLFDAHAIIHRAYHALPDFASSTGEPTGALYGLSTILMKLIGDLAPDYMVACYDMAAPTFRKEMYDEYKAGRAKADAELIEQLKKSRQIFEAFGIPVYEKAGFEADDIIGTIVEELKGKKDLQIVIASGDMDTMQLVEGDRVVVYTMKKGISDTITYNETAVRERYGFAPEHVTDFKGLKGDPSDNIIGVAGIGDKTATELIQKFGTVENIYAELNKDPAILEKKGVKKRTIELLQKGEDEAIFSKTLATLRRDAPIDFKLPATWRENFDLAQVEKVFQALDFKSLVGRVRNLAGAGALATKAETEDAAEIEPLELKKLSIAVWLLDSDITTPTAEDIFEFAGTKDLEKAKKYIFELIKKNKLERVYEEVELPLIPIIKAAEERGILIDKKYLADLGKDYHKKLAEFEKKIYKLAGEEFNINSPKQLSEVLFDKLHISDKGLKKTAGGARSTRESELLKLREGNPIIDEILQYRELQKLLSTYIDNIPGMLDKSDRLHTTLNQAGTTTGRMSSNNPNLQNIPARDGLGAAIRDAFIATPGFELLDLDYSQIEMRVLAVLSGDENLTQIFKEGKDVHSAVASLVFGVPESEVTKEMRRRAKVINFGIIYGMGVNALRANLGSTRDEAQKFYDEYFAKLPKIKSYFDNVKLGALKNGYTETYFGRRRYFPDIKSRLPFVRSNAERMAMNAPLQGTAADIVKIAMARADQALEEAKLDKKVFLLLQIHDELLYEAEKGVAEKALEIIKEAIENVLDSGVPITASANRGKTWGELK